MFYTDVSSTTPVIRFLMSEILYMLGSLIIAVVDQGIMTGIFLKSDMTDEFALY